MKKIITLVLLAVSLTAFAEEKVQIGELYYYLNETDKTAETTYQYHEKWNYADLLTVTIPSTVTYNNVTYTVTVIGDETFFWCQKLQKVTLPNTITTIGIKAFYVCESLTSIDLPQAVTVINSSAFVNCTNLESIIIGNNVTRIGQDAFYDCLHLSSIEIPASVISIGERAFLGCTRLKSVKLGDGIKKIRKQCFQCCFKLQSVIIGKNVQTIEDYAFNSCEKLSSITCYAEIPPTCGDKVFDKVDNSIPLYVPAKSVSAYGAADVWKVFDALPIQ